MVVISVDPVLLNSSALIISTGTAESPMDRGAERVPTTAIFSTSASLASVCSCAYSVGEIESAIEADRSG